MANKRSATGFLRKSLIFILESINKAVDFFKNIGKGDKSSQQDSIRPVSSESRSFSASRKTITIGIAALLVLAIGGVSTGNVIATNNELEEEVSSLETSYNSLNSDYSSLNESYQTCEEERYGLDSKYQTCSGELSSLEGEYSDLQGKYTTYRKGWDKTNQTLISTESDLDSCKEEKEELEGDVSELESDQKDMARNYAFAKCCSNSDHENGATKWYNIDDDGEDITCTDEDNGESDVKC